MGGDFRPMFRMVLRLSELDLSACLQRMYHSKHESLKERILNRFDKDDIRACMLLSLAGFGE